ncbi:FKBP-type peptidyl-prolyl cis-trans isomerase, partial [Nocardioides sp.]|uniref:FKBP-type peptidyl-prolyl cis-trans isomerase n=1 Tax=Nocardioides sp. TaxID=35761 RepID=UPI002B27663A
VAVDTPEGSVLAPYAQDHAFIYPAYSFTGLGEDVSVEQTYDAEKPFDASYGRETVTTALGRGAVIQGWDDALVGLNVGSRVMLEIPPNLGYGKQGSGEDIPGGSTLYFLIDVLAAG